MMASAARAESGQRYLLEGKYTVADWGRYINLPFVVAENTTAIKVKYSYAADDGKPAVLEIGIHDPQKFRGSSSANKPEFTVAASRDLTTPSYIPGAIPAGEWRVELGIPTIRATTAFLYGIVGLKPQRPSSIVNWKVEIELSSEPVGAPFIMPPITNTVLSDKPGWYRGDLHGHSTHSDGANTLAENFKVAHNLGLDFITPTEHNTTSHFAFIPDLQAGYNDLLVLYGYELTTYLGHANVYLHDTVADYRATMPGYDINQVIDQIHAAGGYFSPNHPADFLDAGIPYLLDQTDWSKVDFFEVINGKTKLLDSLPNPINLKAIKMWDELIQKGHRITAIGGSDAHQAGKAENPIGSEIGTPTTVVYAQSLSVHGIMKAMAAGRVYILNDAKNNMTIDFTATAGDKSAMMGDLIAAPEIAFRIKLDHAKFTTLFIIENGLPLPIPIMTDSFTYSFKRSPRSAGYLRLEVKSGEFLKLVTNPIYYKLP
jgi:predicted metal-dependent phosphoesterase TrpH